MEVGSPNSHKNSRIECWCYQNIDRIYCFENPLESVSSYIFKALCAFCVTVRCALKMTKQVSEYG